MRHIEVASILLKLLPALMRYRSCTFLPIGEFRGVLSVGLFKNFKNNVPHSAGLQLDLLEFVLLRSGGITIRNPTEHKRTLWGEYRCTFYRAWENALGQLPLEILQSVRERSRRITARNPPERKRTLWGEYRCTSYRA